MSPRIILKWCLFCLCQPGGLFLWSFCVFIRRSHHTWFPNIHNCSKNFIYYLSILSEFKCIVYLSDFSTPLFLQFIYLCSSIEFQNVFFFLCFGLCLRLYGTENLSYVEHSIKCSLFILLSLNRWKLCS